VPSIAPLDREATVRPVWVAQVRADVEPRVDADRDHVTHRRLSGSGCGRAVALCMTCDVLPRARYCGRECAQRARRCRQRVAGQHYQQSGRGRWMHAMRQLRYRLQRKKVTHQLARISANAAKVASTTPLDREALTRCARCGRAGVVDEIR
jgi:hypothetical protein